MERMEKSNRRMKAIIFAGGIGTRLWPLSRRQSPKQFEKVIGDKSTVQLAVERLLPDFRWEDIYIATNENYVPIIRKQLPNIFPENIIGEPETRDVGPAVGLLTSILYKKYPKNPIVILWSDHIVQNNSLFRQILGICRKMGNELTDKVIFIGQKPRFASQNLGWIEFGNNVFTKDGLNFFAFRSFYYRPEMTQAKSFLAQNHFTWNVGYFVTTPYFIWQLFQKHQPYMFVQLNKILKSVDTSSFKSVLKKVYPKLPKISFDNAILEKIAQNDAWVISENLGWSDIGAWEALKEALQTAPEQNIIQGKVMLTDCRDSLVYNYTNQMVVTIDLDGLIVINTHDVVLVCPKNSVSKIKQFVEKLATSGNEHLT